jgi:SWIM zinc finger
MVSQVKDEVKRAANIRRAHERAIAENVHVEPMGDAVTALHFIAQSSHDKATWYTVTMGQYDEMGIAQSCNCPAGQKGLACKHQAAAENAWRAEYYRQARASLEAIEHKLTPEARRMAGLSD